MDPESAARDRTIGWIEAVLFLIAISTLMVVYAIALHAGAHVSVFILYATGFAAAGMLALSGIGTDAKAIIAAPQSWVFGGLSVAMEGFYFLLLGYVSPAEASLAVRLAVPASLLTGWAFFARSLGRTTMWGALIVVLAVIPIFFSLPSDKVIPALVLACVCSAIVAFKTFASEFHPWNQAAQTVKEKLRVTGLVVLATSVAGAIALLPLTALVEFGFMESNGLVPDAAAYVHAPTVILAILIGAPFLFAMNYLTFSSVVRITTENFLALSAFAPLVALVVQSIAASAGLIEVPAFELWLLPVIALGIVGVLIIVRARRFAG